MEEQISTTLNNIQLSRGVEDLIEGEFSEEDVEQLEDVLDGCDSEYKNLFATLDQLGSCLDEASLITELSWKQADPEFYSELFSTSLVRLTETSSDSAHVPLFQTLLFQLFFQMAGGNAKRHPQHPS